MWEGFHETVVQKDRVFTCPPHDIHTYKTVVVSKQIHKKKTLAATCTACSFPAKCTKKKPPLIAEIVSTSLTQNGNTNKRAQHNIRIIHFGVLALKVALLPLRPPCPENAFSFARKPKIVLSYFRALIRIDSDRIWSHLFDAPPSNSN